ncbi:DUF3791 domain-containing protein [Clostridium gasigenes]|uniref:DUF3791 domain-containing protein n=1 Tax=Clostridium gasigenes TaxID=94869 RepID=A0A7X0VQ33_9CLOT|nr:DUF3791 domain-containing protein [Clostridium gasigenes]MBB6713115.1 DUF3791 domain-containing protein [Clostridium gasigenes]
MSKEEQNMIDYIVVCINEFADKIGINYKDAFNYLNRYNAISFIKENYEIEHTLSIDDAIDDMIMVAQNNGGSLI